MSECYRFPCLVEGGVKRLSPPIPESTLPAG